MENQTGIYRDVMSKAKLHNTVIDTFLHYYELLVSGESGQLTKAEIEPPESTKITEYEDLQDENTDNLSKLIVIKLNGGLGTTMGLKKAKSLLPVKGELNFLDIITRQTLAAREETGKQIPLIFMNSFNTNEDTLDYLANYPNLSLFEVPLSFTQNKYPRIRQDNLKPYFNEDDEQQNWNPPGHGDLYQAISISGVLDKLLNAGIEYAFISNSDNLGAVVEPKILNYIVSENIPFLMEVCNRLEVDKKGGHLAQDGEKRLLLREIAQCPDAELEEFQDIGKYRYFNTNNLWLNLKALKAELQQNSNLFLLPLILNRKEVEETKVYQIETAMGAAIGKFNGAKALVVPRERFAPVKKTSDLLTVWSDVYQLTDDYKIRLDPRVKEIPYIDLDDRYYKTIEQLQDHFPNGAPSLVKCKSLKVEGDVLFGEDNIVEGKAIIKANDQLYIFNELIAGEYVF